MKVFCVFLSMLMLLGLVGCTDVEKTNKNIVAQQDVAVLTVWLDDEGFVPGISQSEMIDKMKGYTHNGRWSVGDFPGVHYDGQNGGGYDATGGEYGFANDFSASNDRTTAVYTNSFYTRVPLDGLTLPLGMGFDDTLHYVIEKLGIGIKLPSEFTPDGGNDYTMTLYEDERYTLVFKNLNFSEGLIITKAPYELIFTENYTFTRDSGSVSNVTRTMKLLFKPDEDMLYEFGVIIRESYNLT